MSRLIWTFCVVINVFYILAQKKREEEASQSSSRKSEEHTVDDSFVTPNRAKITKKRNSSQFQNMQILNSTSDTEAKSAIEDVIVPSSS